MGAFSAGILAFKRFDAKRKQDKHADKVPWQIVYATKSGNAKLVAQELQKSFAKNGMEVKCKNISTLKLDAIKRLSHLFIVISTDGEGDPPPSAKNLFKQLQNNSNNNLSELNISVCSLGDSSYEQFCQAGKDLENLLQNHGATSFIERVDCDEDFAETARGWIQSVLNRTISKPTESTVLEMSPKHEILDATVNKVQKLTLGISEKPCYHVELDLSKDVSFVQPGDTIEIMPENPEWLVNEIISILRLSDEKKTRTFLLREAEITKLSRRTIKRYQEFAQQPTLDTLLNDEAALGSFMAQANFLDLLQEYPSKPNLHLLRTILPALRGRMYSIASSTLLNKHALHLTIKSIRYQFLNRLHEGAGSVYVTEKLTEGKKIGLKHFPNPEFRLPENTDTPIIMIGTGTGIAPFRAFLQHYHKQQSNQNLWLIWGDRSSKQDFIYADEMDLYRTQNTLAKTNFAFSRDSEQKVYVQDLLHSEKENLQEWVKKGAHFYICGSTHMGEAVKSTLQHLLQPNGKNNSHPTLETLFAENRYHEDVY